MLEQLILGRLTAELLPELLSRLLPLFRELFEAGQDELADREERKSAVNVA